MINLNIFHTNYIFFYLGKFLDCQFYNTNFVSVNWVTKNVLVLYICICTPNCCLRNCNALHYALHNCIKFGTNIIQHTQANVTGPF